jgi:phosphoglycerate-specific signal transduction histidine kinase
MTADVIPDLTQSADDRHGAPNDAHGTRARRRGRFGIRIKLLIAFAVVAAMTVVAAEVAIVSFSATERGVEQVATEEVPVMTDALRLSATAGEVSAAAARLVNAATADEQREIARAIAASADQLAAIMNHLRASQQGDAAFSAVEEVSRRLDPNLKALETAISERAQARAALAARIDAVHKLHTRISERLAPIVDDSYFELVTTAEDVGKGADRIVKSLVNDGLQLMQTIVQIGAETNLITGLLTASSLTSSPAIMSMLEDRFAASVGRLKKQMLKLPEDAKYGKLRQQLVALSAVADFRVRPAAGGSEGDLNRLGRVFEIHEALSGVLLTLVDDLNFDLVAQSDEAVKHSSKLIGSLVANQISQLRRALEIDAQSHLIAGLMSEGAVAKDSVSLVPVQDRFKGASISLEKAISTLSQRDLAALAVELLNFGRGADSLFALRARELAASGRADRTIEENVAIQRELDQAVARLVGQAEAAMKEGTGRLIGGLDRNRKLLIAVAGASLLAAVAVGLFYVQRRLIRRLSLIGEAMARLSCGETDAPVPALADADEIGEMARSLAVFRAAEIERVGLVQRAQAEEASARQRSSAVNQMVGDFRAVVTAAVSAVIDNAGGRGRTSRRGSTRGVGVLGDELCERAQRGHVGRGTRRVDPRALRSRRPGQSGGRTCQRNRPHGQRPDRPAVHQRQPDRRRGQADPLDCRANQFAGSQCHDRGGARRRGGSRLCGGGGRSQDLGQPDRQGDRGDRRPGRCDPKLDRRHGRSHAGDRRGDGRHQPLHHHDCGCRRPTERRHAGHRSQRRRGGEWRS